MPAVNARTLITDAFVTIGVFSPGVTIPSDKASEALRRLNAMMSSLRLQTLTQPVVSREVFPLTANLGVYTIGPGGDFDTTRPIGLSGAGIVLNSQGTPVSVSSLTRSGGIATVTAAGHGAESGQNVTIAGADPADYNGTFPVTVLTSSTFTYVLDGLLNTPATGTITASVESNENNVVEVPRAVLTDDAWQQIRIKSLTAAQFTSVYYNATFGGGDLGTVYLWPIPNVATNSIALYRLQPLSSFANLNTQYYLPDGAEEALMYTFARRLLAPNGISAQSEVGQEVSDMARETMANFKRANTKPADMPTDPALTMYPTGGYNINTGQSGGGSTGF